MEYTLNNFIGDTLYVLKKQKFGTLEFNTPKINNLSNEEFYKFRNTYYIEKDNFEICQRFVDAGININCRTEDATPMLNVAIRSEQNRMVEWLLSQNVDIDAVSNDRGYSAVMDAVWKNNYELTKTLVERGANLNFIGRDGQSVLVLAVGAGKLNICQLLADSGADPDIKDQMGMSAYGYAKLFNRTDIVEALEKHHKE